MSTIALLLALAPWPSSAVHLQPAPSVCGGTQQDWAESVRRGRALIAAGKGAAARSLLEAADKADGGQLRTRIWFVRALIEVDFLNDALDMIDDLSTAGHSGPEIDYLYGMAFIHKARKYIAQSVDLSMVGMHFADALKRLQSATTADPERFADAFLPLAEAAWQAQQLDVARSAADQAVERFPQAAAAHFMRAEIAFSQYVVANADPTRKLQAEELWQTTYDSFQRSAQLDQLEGGDRWRLAQAYNKSGNALLWQSRPEQAAQQYTNAMEYSPRAVDCGQLYSSLAPSLFASTVEKGSQAFEARFGAKDKSDGALLWWIGYARFVQNDYDGSRLAFERAYAKWPEAANSLWYIALCNFNQEQLDGALEALTRMQQIDPAALNQALLEDSQRYLPILDRLVSHCRDTKRLLDAARLSAAQGNAAPLTSRYWNNVGLFYRFAGNQLPQQAGLVKDRALQRGYYEKALEGYERALAIHPQDPALLNDTAVVLHYCLETDLARARSMYLAAQTRAKAELAREDLSAQDRKSIEAVLHDSQKNLPALDELIAERAAHKQP